VIHRVLVLAAYICCGLVIASFALFARDQFAGASEHQQTQLLAGSDTPTAAAGPTTTSTDTTPSAVQVKAHHGQPRRFIDGAASALTSPFRAALHSDSKWVVEIEGVVLGLLVYGVGLGFVARYVRPEA
jgi:hypothetical protein